MDFETQLFYLQWNCWAAFLRQQTDQTPFPLSFTFIHGTLSCLSDEPSYLHILLIYTNILLILTYTCSNKDQGPILVSNIKTKKQT